MYSQSRALAIAFEAVVSQTEQPVPGTIIRSLHGLPIRIHCQIKKTATERSPDDTTPPEIFAYATVVPLRPGLIASNIKHYAHDFGSTDFHGTKAVLLSNSRVKVLRAAAEDDVLRTSDVLPVMALKVVASSASGRALKVEVSEYCSDDVLERCAGLVLACRRLEELQTTDGTPPAVLKEAEEYAKQTLADFYATFEQDAAAAAAAATAAATPAIPATPQYATPATPVIPAMPEVPEVSEVPVAALESNEVLSS